MNTPTAFDIQGHRGAHGLMTENTLPSFEVAIDLGVTSIETDVHLSKDDVPILFHDAEITERMCPAQSINGSPLVRSFTVAELRRFRVGPHANATPLAKRLANERGFNPFGIPTLAEFFAFVSAYADASDKTAAQRERARQLWFELELKRVPFRPETIGDGFNGSAPALLERRVHAAILHAGVLQRTRVRSFDHRSLRAMKLLEPSISIAVLTHHTAPADVGILMDAMQADLYCPDFQFVDAEIVKRVHEAGKRVVPYTVNESKDWERLLAWGVDGVTTDFPDRLVAWLGRAS